MAVWQFDCILIPRRNSNEEFWENDRLSWKGTDQKDKVKEKVGNILTESNSWSSEVLIFGDIEGTCIKLICEKEDLDEVVLRLDLRSLSKSDLNILLSLLQDIGAMIFYNNRIYEVEEATMIELIANSDAAKFCLNPEMYLKNCKK